MTSFNLRIFELLVDESYSVRDLAKEVKCSPAKVTQFVKLFGKMDLLVIRQDKNRKIIGINRENALAQGIVSLIFSYKILNSGAFGKLKDEVSSIGVYGSVVEGTMDKHSDIDLWVLSDKKSGFVNEGKIRQEFVKELGREVSIKFFTPASIKKLKEKDKIFYNEMVYKSKLLWGEGFG